MSSTGQARTGAARSTPGPPQANPSKKPPETKAPETQTPGAQTPGAQTQVTALQWWVLVLAAVGSFMVILDMLVVATALTAIQRDLHASMADLEWTVNAYTLSFAVLLMTSASLGDRFGRRRLFVAGLALFSLARRRVRSRPPWARSSRRAPCRAWARRC